MRKQLWITAALTAAAALSVSVSAFAGQWKQDGNGWWWDRGDGTWPSSMWEWIDGDENGVEECYCFDAAGYMYAGTMTPDGYTVNADGAWVENGVVQTRTQAQPQAQTQTQSYFEKYGVDVPDGPVSCTNDYVNYNFESPQEHQRVGEAVWKQTDCYTTPADTEGYQLVHLNITVETPTYYDVEQNVNYNYVTFGSLIYDWYTGQQFPNRNTIGGDVQEYGTTLNINGKSYDVSYTYEIQWEEGGNISDAAGNIVHGFYANQKYVFRVPDGYDGLVYCAGSKREYTEFDTDTVYGQEKAVYAFDDEENRTENKYFRINRQPLPALDDHVMDWKDAALEEQMRRITGINDRDIMLSDVYEIKTLDLSGIVSFIKSVEALGELKNLTYLDLGHNQISDITALSNLTSLTELQLGYNQISDITALSNLTSLTVLHLGDNQIRDITPLKDLTSLQWLELYRNQISDISALSNLTSLSTLYLTGNQITDITALTKLTDLGLLDLGGNRVSDVTPLSDKTSLTYLFLGNNLVSDVSPLAGLTSLVSLELYGNPVSDYSPVEFVGSGLMR